MAKKHRQKTDEIERSVSVVDEVEPAADSSDEEQVEQEQIAELGQDKPDRAEGSEPELAFSSPQPSGKFKRCLHWLGTHKKASIPLGLVVILALLAAIPLTRYALAGTFLKQDFTVLLLDEQTGKPVSAATVSLAGKQVSSSGQGRATLHAAVGKHSLTATKKYYQDATQTVTVPIFKQKGELTIRMHATGRQVPVSVVNKINGKPLAGVSIKAGDSEAKTDTKGEAVLVVAADKASVAAQLSGQGFNSASVPVKVTTGVDAANKFGLTPSGKIYFLSNLSGKLDVVKTNLDGTDRQTVLAGTGKEDKQNTVLLATTDWKYLALLSKRDGGDNAKLFLLDTSSDKLTTMDEGKATFTMTGWSGHRFVYQVFRNELKSWAPNRVALKSFNAENGQLATLDQTAAEGVPDNYVAQNFGYPYLVSDKVVYATNWISVAYSYSNPSALTSKTDSIRTVDVTGANKKDLKTFPASNSNYFATTSYEANTVLFQVNSAASNPAVSYYEYEDGTVKTTQSTDDAFRQSYPTFLASPSGNQTFWSEARDGKNTLFIGDKDGKNGKQVAVLSDQQTFGWYTDDYLLVSKNASELYIMPVSGENPLKVSDYYKPQVVIRGYGGGYGGL